VLGFTQQEGKSRAYLVCARRPGEGRRRPPSRHRKERKGGLGGDFGGAADCEEDGPIARKTVRSGSELFGQNSQVPEIGDRVSNRKGTPHVRP
jgi:hypothetical protein